MAVTKEHKEFHTIDLQGGWQRPAGYSPDVQVWEKILAGGLDTVKKRGSQTRLLRFAAGAYTTQPFVHDFWAEVYLVSGELTVGSNDCGEGGTVFTPNTYACQPPGVWHGPFKSEGGCVLLEIQYYDPTTSVWLSARSCRPPPSASAWRGAALG